MFIVPGCVPESLTRAQYVTLYHYVQTKEGNAQRQALAHEQEKNLPGVIMASRKKLFDKLEQLCVLGNAHVITGVRNLLMLIPTDRSVSDVLEVFTHQTPGGASEDPDSALSPQAVLEKYFTPSSASPTQLLYNLEVCRHTYQHIDEVTSKYGIQCSKGLPINVYLATALHRQGCIQSVLACSRSVAKILQNPVQHQFTSS